MVSLEQVLDIVNRVTVVVYLLNHVQLFCDPMDRSPPGSSLHGISQARILEWVTISFLRDLPDSEIEPTSPALQVDSLSLSHWGSLMGNYK